MLFIVLSKQYSRKCQELSGLLVMLFIVLSKRENILYKKILSLLVMLFIVLSKQAARSMGSGAVC